MSEPSNDTAGILAELDAWIDANWNPDLTVAEWWERLGLAGWAHPALPANAYGRDLARNDAIAVSARIAERGALGAPAGLGMLLAAPTIAAHGTQAQIDRYVRPIVTGQHAWCQLFSEPGAGSDLASLGTRAVRDGEEWIASGQKVWTSGGHVADMGMLIARTAPDQPKHQGITWFAMSMHQPDGRVDIRPLREMTGRALFNEVFLSEARIDADAMIGGLNNGWAVANTTLAFERAGLGAGGASHAGAAAAGSVVGDLDKRAGDFVSGRPAGSGGAAAMTGGVLRLVREMARAGGQLDDPTVRQAIAKLHTLNEIGRFNTLRQKALRSQGSDLPGFGNIGKLGMSEIVRQTRDLGLRLAGGYGMLHAYKHADRQALDAATGMPMLAIVTEQALFAQAPPIYGGTDQVQRNIIGERVLGLPKEPSNERVTPWSELPRNG